MISLGFRVPRLHTVVGYMVSEGSSCVERLSLLEVSQKLGGPNSSPKIVWSFVVENSMQALKHIFQNTLHKSAQVHQKQTDCCPKELARGLAVLHCWVAMEAKAVRILHYASAETEKRVLGTTVLCKVSIWSSMFARGR